jgi:hypothetical protein
MCYTAFCYIHTKYAYVTQNPDDLPHSSRIHWNVPCVLYSPSFRDYGSHSCSPANPYSNNNMWEKNRWCERFMYITRASLTVAVCPTAFKLQAAFMTVVFLYASYFWHISLSYLCLYGVVDRIMVVSFSNAKWGGEKWWDRCGPMNTHVHGRWYVCNTTVVWPFVPSPYWSRCAPCISNENVQNSETVTHVGLRNTVLWFEYNVYIQSVRKYNNMFIYCF